MKILLTSVEPALTEAWKRHCGHIKCVEVVDCSMLDVDADALVSPANSFGFMDGNLDYLLREYFGHGIETRLQGIIQNDHHGELPVGQAVLLMTGHSRHPLMISAPTMRVPSDVSLTVSPYLAARAAILKFSMWEFNQRELAYQTTEAHGAHFLTGNELEYTIAFPGLGTGCGAVPPDRCARQMAQAIQSLALGVFGPDSWRAAQDDHFEMING